MANKGEGLQNSPDQLTLFQLGWADYAPHITTCPHSISDLPMALTLSVTVKSKTSRKLTWHNFESLPEHFVFNTVAGGQAGVGRRQMSVVVGTT